MEIRPILSALLRSKTGALLIAAQIALTLAIVANALYVIDDRLARAARPSGFDEANTFGIVFAGIRASDDAEAMQRRDVDTLRAIPGVAGAAWANQFPLSRSGWGLGLTLTPQDPASGVGGAAYFTPDSVTEGFGLKIVEGRDFTADDVRTIDLTKGQLSAGTIILSREMARRLLPDEPNVVGKTVYLGGGADAEPMRIVGVVERMVTPWAQVENGDSSFILPVRALGTGGGYLVRTEPGQRDRVMREAEEALRKLRADRVLISNRGLDEYRAQRYQAENAVAQMLIAVTVGLLLVTASGIVGLASLWVAQRRKQIGVRRALGARRFDILRYFVLENVLITTAGIVVGIGLALALNQLLVSALELPRLPLGYLGAGMLILWALGILAVYGPAWRASAVSPAIATRSA